MIQIIYMAAGNSRRFGENKLLHIYEGKPLYRHSLDMLIKLLEGMQGAYVDAAIVVVTQYDSILKETEELSMRYPFLRAVYCEESRMGVSYTIEAGIRAYDHPGNGDYFLFLVADQPGLSEETMLSIGRIALAEGPETISASYDGRPGNPCAFRADLREELLSLSGDKGGRSIIKKHECVYIPVRSEKELLDIDTKEDLA